MPAVTFGLDELKRILVDRVGLPEDAIPDDPETTFSDLGLDSLARVEVVLAIQQDHDIPVPDEAAQQFVRLRDPIDFVARQRGEGEGLTGGGRTDNSVVIAAPLQLVWDAMNDIESWPQLFSEYAAAEVLHREGDTVRFRLTTHPDPEHGGAVWTWVSERTVDPVTHTTHARRIETGPFRFMHIDWSFTAVGGGTEMRWVQHFAMNAGAPVDDAGAEEYLNRNTRTQMAVIKERLERAAAEAPTIAA